MDNSLINRIWRVFLRLTYLMTAFSSVWLFFLMFVMTGDVAGRIFFNQPLPGTAEIVKASIVGIVFLQFPHTLYMNRHIRSDIIQSRMRPLGREILNVPIFLLGAVICVLIFIAQWEPTMTSWAIGEYEGAADIRVPVYPIHTLILLGSSTAAIHFSVLLGKTILRLTTRGKEA